MTDTGRVPGEGQPENAGMVEQRGAPAPDAYPYLSESTSEDDDLLLLPGARGAWGNEVAPPAPEPVVEVLPPPAPRPAESGAPHDTGASRPASPDPANVTLRRPLHLGPLIPDASASPVRSLADRGPARQPIRDTPTSAEPPTAPDAPPTPRDPAEPGPDSPEPGGPKAVVTRPEPVPGPVPPAASGDAAQAVVARVSTEAVAATGGTLTALPMPPGDTSAPAAPVPQEKTADGEEAPHGAEPPVPERSAPAAADEEARQRANAAPPPEDVPPPEATRTVPDRMAVRDRAPFVDVPPALEATTPASAPVAPPAPDTAAPEDSRTAVGGLATPGTPDADTGGDDAAPDTGAEEPTGTDVGAGGPALPPGAEVPPAHPDTRPPDPADPLPVPSREEPEPTGRAGRAGDTERASEAEEPPTDEPALPESGTFLQKAPAPEPAAHPAPGPESTSVPLAETAAGHDSGADRAGAPIASTDRDPESRGVVPLGSSASVASPSFPEPAAPTTLPQEQEQEQEQEHSGDAESGQEARALPEAVRGPGAAPESGRPDDAPPSPPTSPAAPLPSGEPSSDALDRADLRPPTPPADRTAPEGPDAPPARPDPENLADPEAPDRETASGPRTGEESPAPDAAADDVPAGPSRAPAAPGYADSEREAILRVMRERRDIRNGFRDDPVPHEVLLRVLEAAHTAPSVGQSQPWDFVVIRSPETRRAMHELAERQREAYATSLPKGRAKQFRELKIEAILDTPVNIVVTADPTRGGRHTLGRHTQPQMAPYSAALAVENLWLAARAEGLGVGWVSFFDEREMVRALDLPEHLEVVAYLCLGYVDAFPDEPELTRAGWSKRRPLSWVVHEESYGRRALPGEDPHDLLGETVAQIRPLDAKALGQAWERQKRMTKPAGALGMLEIISAQLSGLSRQCPPPIPEPAAVAIFAGDHGVHAQGVTPWAQEVTGQMVANFLSGGAVCNAFAAQVGAEVCVVDVGVATDLPATPGLLPRRIRPATSDMTAGPAMSREEARQAIEIGIETARDLVSAGNKALLTGEMGIANTTASAALIAVFTGADPSEVTGRGTGVNDETLARKTEVVRRAIELHRPDPADPIGVLAAIGGFEHAAIVGLLLGGAALRTPVILDGVSAGAAALVARAIAPEVLAACIAGHRSAEPGHVAALNKLGLRPLVDLDLRLGEGTGALLALPLVQSTARAMHEVATFDSAGVTES
ncbi:nicotinate-nucleotide--dimethylbenzimidazole phosphoribosyltransferase [Streptomyces sp. HSG2]|uniref:nicotinate-nucleotide--dimethylbenzimidazole phosphoribosyltransferase n=1 Tax=Streptomyces sp. HSG2 TaxID=2797167 RepID=UPI001906259E|nr:nicotinate-nucleotide--dimethylbenzimidazole phosphoribosyltransferase [Streptomyces sp. HSG2]